jgi:hypothetical protein
MVKTARSSVGLTLAGTENPLSISFSQVKKLDKADGGEVDKTELLKLRFLLVHNNQASKDSRQIFVFKDGCLDKWI